MVDFDSDNAPSVWENGLGAGIEYHYFAGDGEVDYDQRLYETTESPYSNNGNEGNRRAYQW